MFLFVIFLLPFVVNAALAINACGVCGTNSGVMCIDDTTFAFCTSDRKPISGRHECPKGMVCVDDFLICVNGTTIPDGTPTCQSKCGKCAAQNRFACRSTNTFSLCYGKEQPSSIVHRCPTNTICSTTKDPSSKQFCFDPVTLNDEDINCYEPTTSASSVFARFIAAAPQPAITPLE